MTRSAGSRDEPSIRLARLPPGRHGLPREFVTRNQRDRLAAGTIATVAECGLNDATITRICAAAGVSRRTFYTYFSSKEECYSAAFDTVVKHLRTAAEAASEDEPEWPLRVRSKLKAILEFLAINPDLARFILISPQRAGEGAAARYRAMLEDTVDYLCEGFAETRKQPPSAAVAGSLIGGMVALVVRKVEAGEGERLPDLVPDLVELFLAPFVGRAEALRVARSA